MLFYVVENNVCMVYPLTPPPDVLYLLNLCLKRKERKSIKHKQIKACLLLHSLGCLFKNNLIYHFMYNRSLHIPLQEVYGQTD